MNGHGLRIIYRGDDKAVIGYCTQGDWWRASKADEKFAVRDLCDLYAEHSETTGVLFTTDTKGLMKALQEYQRELDKEEA